MTTGADLRFGSGAGDAGAATSTLIGDGLLLVNVTRLARLLPLADLRAPLLRRRRAATPSAQAGGPSFIGGTPSPPEPTARVFLRSFAFWFLMLFLFGGDTSRGDGDGLKATRGRSPLPRPLLGGAHLLPRALQPRVGESCSCRGELLGARR